MRSRTSFGADFTQVVIASTSGSVVGMVLGDPLRVFVVELVGLATREWSCGRVGCLVAREIGFAQGLVGLVAGCESRILAHLPFLQHLDLALHPFDDLVGGLVMA